MTEIPEVDEFQGEIPDKGTQTDINFANNIYAFLYWCANTFVTAINTLAKKLNLLSEEINTSASQASQSASQALQSANTATASANNKGSWKNLKGTFPPGISVNHENSIWISNNILIDITQSEPNISNDDWTKALCDEEESLEMLHAFSLYY